MYDIPRKLHRWNVFRRQARRIQANPSSSEYRNKKNDVKKPRKRAVSLAKPLAFPLQLCNIAPTAKPTYNLWVPYEPTKTVMRTATCLIYTGAVGNLTNSPVIAEKWRNRVKRKKVPTLRTATKQQLPLEQLIVLHLCLGHLNTHIRFRMSQNLAVDELLETSFIGRSMRIIFHVEQKAVLWQFEPGFIFSRKVKHTNKPTIRSSETEATINSQQPAKDKKHALVWVARQIVLKPFAQHAVIVMKTSDGPNTINQINILQTNTWSVPPTA